MKLIFSNPTIPGTKLKREDINGLTGKTAGITITPKTITGNVFDITQQQKTVLKWTFCLGVPVVVLIVGIVIWARRKNK